MSRRSTSGSALVVAALLVMAVAPTAATAAQGHGPPPHIQPGPPDHAPRGQAALDKLGSRLPAVARNNGLSTADLRDLFMKDLTLSVDDAGQLFYVDVRIGEAQADPSEPAATSAPPTTDPVFFLHSRPDADHVIYLDFDGHITTGTSWNSAYGNTLVSPPYDLDGSPDTWSPAELVRIADAYQIVVEDFAAFDVDVTTEEPSIDRLIKADGSDTQWGVRVVVTKDVWASCGCGGFAYINSFNRTTDTPVFVFNSSLAGVAEAASHEVGHSLGLAHDGTATATYYYGHGSGEQSLAPIMGAGYSRTVTQFSKGEYYRANNNTASANYGRGPDDLVVITTYNGFGYRPDDHANTSGGATVLGGPPAATDGVLETTSDIDTFRFSTGGGTASFTIDTVAIRPNVNLRAILSDGAGNVVAESDSTASLSAFFDLSLASGTYYIAVDAIGNGDPFSTSPTGHTEYGGIGQYSLSGTFVPTTGTPNNPPTAGFTAATSDLTASFTDTSSDTDGTVASWAWDFGDTNTSTEQNPVHDYATAGTYTVSLTVTDDDGDSGVTSQSVTVGDPPPPPNAGLYLAFKSSVTFGGVTAALEDILQWDGASTYTIAFDGSDVGLSGFKIDGFDVIGAGQVLLSFVAPGNVPGVGSVDDSDIVLFTGTLGEATSGTFAMYFDGSDVGLDSNNEDIDGLAMLADGSLLISTMGSFGVSGVSGQDEDVIQFTGTFGSSTSGAFSLYFDGSDVEMTNKKEDIDALASDGANLYFSTIDNFNAGGLEAEAEDVLMFSGTFEPATSGTFVIFWDGSTEGITESVVGIDLS